MHHSRVELVPCTRVDYYCRRCRVARRHQDRPFAYACPGRRSAAPAGPREPLPRTSGAPVVGGACAAYRRSPTDTYVQRLVFGAVFSPMFRILQKVDEMSIWGMEPLGESLDMPSFSHLPQEYITTVADLLLSVLPQLEPFADSNTNLGLAVKASVGVEKLYESEWKSVANALDIPYSQFEEHHPMIEASDSSHFVDLWTSQFGSACMALLTSRIMQIARLSTTGAEQLQVDLVYFQNVLNALGIPLHPSIECLLEVLTMPKEDLQSTIKVTASSSLDNKFKLRIQRLVAKKRGILVDFDDS